MFEFLVKKIKYPSYAVSNNIQGTVYVSFIVNKDGKMSGIKVVKGVHTLLDDEAVRVIKKFKKWTAGTVDGYPVRMRMTLPVKFKIK